MPTRVAASEAGPVWAAQLFLISLLVPFYLPVGQVVLMPHRIVLLVFFIPFAIRLFLFQGGGRLVPSDWLFLGVALWAGVALAVNHPIGVVIEPFGVFMIEFFGAYLLSRVAIRSDQDFRRMVRTLFFIMIILLPFAAAESITRRPVMLELLPGTSVRPVDAGIRLGLRRAQAVFAHPILFGVFVSTGLGLFWYALRPRWLKYPGVLVVAAATVFSVSTGALLSFLIQAVFIGWEAVVKTFRHRWRLMIILAVLGYVGIDLLSNRSPFHVLATYGSFTSGIAYNRILIWEHGTANVWNNPVFGLGLNDWVRPSWMKASVDNYWLFLTMSYGLPVIVMVALALGSILRRVSRAALADSEARLCRAGYLVSLGGLVLAGGTVHYWHAAMAFAMFIIGSGVWASFDTGRRDPETKEQGSDRLVPRSRYTRQVAPNTPIGDQPDRPLRATRARTASR